MWMRWRSMAAVCSKGTSPRNPDPPPNHGSTCRWNRPIRATNSDRNQVHHHHMKTSDAKPGTMNGRVRSDERDVREATGPHQADFPYERDEEAQVTRREFCNFLGLTSAALFVGAGGFAGKAALDARRTETFVPLKIEGAAQLLPGTSLNFRYPTERDTAILVRLVDGRYQAFGQ